MSNTAVNELSYIRFLEQSAIANSSATKGARTKLALRVAAARMLSEQGYHSLRLSDVSRTAGLAEGTIYVHYKDREAVIADVMTCYLDVFLRSHLERPRLDAAVSAGDTVFERVRSGVRHWFDLARENRGMFRCMLQMSDDEPRFAVQVQNFNLQWARELSSDQASDARDVFPPLVLVYMMKFLINDLVRKLIVFPDPLFINEIDALGGDDYMAADVASAIWLRVLYPAASAPALDIGPFADLLSWLSPSRTA